jgi:threonine dehydrogenase-like Zn-dependent dehydrogenase
VNWGGFSEYGIARDHWAMKEDGKPREEWDPFRVNQIIPEGIPPAAATMIITWRETLSYLSRTGFSSGMRLLVLGSGGNGLAFVAHAANMGASRIAMVGSPIRKSVALKAGTTDFFDYKLQNLTERVSNVCPLGFDYIIDSVGKKGNFDKFLPVLKPRGVVGIYGIDDYGSCLLNPTRARGTFTYTNAGYDEEETHDRVIGLIQAGKLDAGLWLNLEHPFAFSEIQAAFEAVKSRKMVKALIQLVPVKK